MSFPADSYLTPVLKSTVPNVKNVIVRKMSEDSRVACVMTLIHYSNTEGKVNTDVIIFQASNIAGF